MGEEEEIDGPTPGERYTLFPGAEVPPPGGLLSPTLKNPPGTCDVTGPFGEEMEGAATGVATGLVKGVSAGAGADAEACGIAAARMR